MTTSARARLLMLLAAGLVIRLFFLGNEGFVNDVKAFEAWSLTLAAHPFWQFYGSTQFADYPPGYFYVLWFIGHLYVPFAAHDPQYTVLKVFVKLPAVIMDLLDGALVFALVRRFANDRVALAAATRLGISVVIRGRRFFQREF